MTPDRKQKGWLGEWAEYGSIGVEMMACVLVGAFGGYGLDRLFHTKPWLMIIGFVFGAAAGFLSLFRFVMKEKDKHQ